MIRVARRKVTYNGTDPNLKGMRCEVVGKKGDKYILVTGDEVLGRVEFEVHKSQIK